MQTEECDEVLSLLDIKTSKHLQSVLDSSQYSGIVKQAAKICYKRHQDKIKALSRDGRSKKKNMFSHLLEDGGNGGEDYQKQHDLNQYNVLKKYYDLQLDPPKNYNDCNKTLIEPYVAELTKTQKFLCEYFTPYLSLKGMLLWHSVGSGKTCSLVSIASGHFEEQNWRIIYVCRNSLKNGFYKNVFDTVCHHRMRNMAKIIIAKEADMTGKKVNNKKKSSDNEDDVVFQKSLTNEEIIRNKFQNADIIDIDEDAPVTKKSQKKKKKVDGGNNNYTTIPPPKTSSNKEMKEEKFTNRRTLINKNLWSEPLTYTQLGNLCNRINSKSLGDTPIDKDIKYDYRHDNDAEGKQAAKKDPLYKTLIIIDEAHYIFKEDPDDKVTMNRTALEKALYRSHEISGANSAKVMLLTATPMVTHPIEFIHLMNLLRPEGDRINITDNQFLNMIDTDIEEDNSNEDSVHSTMLNFIGEHFSGYVSYLDRSKDPSQFAQIKKEYVDVEMTKEQESKVKTRVGLNENAVPLPNPNPKAIKQGSGGAQLWKSKIDNALSDEDRNTYVNLVKAKMSNKIPDPQFYAKEIRGLFYHHPDIIEYLLMGERNADGGSQKKKKSKK